MTAALDELLRTLLWEGYALYPYTPGATKNATPTPFGIVYPPVYAAGSPTTFSRIRMQGIVEGGAAASVALELRFMQSAGARHEAVERRVTLPATALEALDGDGVETGFAFGATAGASAEEAGASGALRGRVRMSAQRFDDLLTRVTLDVANESDAPPGLDRAAALAHSLLSTHLLAQVAHGRFHSPVAPPEHAAAAVMACAAVNTFPVLAGEHDEALLGAAIALPDHPQLAPESRGDLFDATEIEEALLLHVLALSDGEREQIAAHDPAVRAMLRRAVAATPAQIAALHGRVTVRDPAPAAPPPRPPGAPPRDGQAGESEAVVDGVAYRPGARVRLRVGAAGATSATAHDHLLAGRAATVERVFVDYDDAVHLGVTLDDDPGRELMRDVGRYLYFRPSDVELVEEAR
ncbi:hypothetical protein VSS74_05950 [Conexibacter stalactiti]|uniref:Uncharacterized protein n=1 Tax=Conexibacter stalactiti TaxID=1940611 RepID=A0ABU4HKM8_9ACTN|nr:hypothetical protein [Conexibacter stalactiti]MDW5593867.1 hypothetical protein [Conexibacter stalactiti]MEC5034509.1 hypothetical protein [Conexibacter stalactiti]